MTTSEASTAGEGLNREQEGTFDHCRNQKITLSKLNDDSSTNNLWIWLRDHHQHCDGLLQEFYAMTQKHKESMGKYAVRLNMAAGKVQLQSQEALGSTPDEWERLLVNHLL